jgi:hypothetical protein
MMKINLVGDYEGTYRVSVVEWVLGILNLVLLVALLLVRWI